ncbi:hypothetical protein ACOMHN_008948 [Nucella lapillus]
MDSYQSAFNSSSASSGSAYPTATVPAGSKSSPPGFDAFGEVLQPLSSGGGLQGAGLSKADEPKLLASDLDTSLASLASNLSVDPTAIQVKKTSHQWQPKGESKLTGGDQFQQRPVIQSSTTWSAPPPPPQPQFQPPMMGALGMGFVAQPQMMAAMGPQPMMSAVTPPPPHHVHLSLGEAPDQVNVMWSTRSPCRVTKVMYGTSPWQLQFKVTGTSANFTGPHSVRGLRHLHRATLTGLQEGKTYFYRPMCNRIGSGPFYFKSPNAHTNWSPRVMVSGDLGTGSQLLPLLSQRALSGQFVQRRLAAGWCVGQPV